MQQDGLEAALTETAERVAVALRASAAATRELKRAGASAATGSVRELRRALDATILAGEALTNAAREARDSYQLDDVEYLASGAYSKEVLAEAAERGVAMFAEDDRLLCYPSLIRVLASDAAVEIDRRREKRLRPSVLVATLEAAQNRPPKFKAEAFLESLGSAYELLAQSEDKVDPVLRLDAIWGVLTLLPGQARDYTRPEFARDLYLLDQSGVMTTKAGRTLRWHASSGTRGAGVLTTVAKSGQQQLYWGSFIYRTELTVVTTFAGVGESVAVLGGGSLSVPEYSAFLSEQYLAQYVPAGGAAVKMAVAGSPDTAARLRRAIAVASDTAGCLFVDVAAEDVRVDQIEQLFFAVTRTIDWTALAASVVRAAYDAVGMPAEGGLTVAEVAGTYEMDARELYRSVRRALEDSLLRNPNLARELGRAVFRLAQAQLGSSDVDGAERDAVLGWLRGEKVPAAALRPALITSRIGRHNARPLLLSLAHLLLSAGLAGLVLCVDYARLAQARRPPLDERNGLYYSKAAVLDAFEVLRQLIDATDELRGVLVLAVVPPELVTDEARGLPSYTALQLRVADEVRDRRRPNPFAALVRLEFGWRRSRDSGRGGS